VKRRHKPEDNIKIDVRYEDKDVDVNSAVTRSAAEIRKYDYGNKPKDVATLLYGVQ